MDYVEFLSSGKWWIETLVQALIVVGFLWILGKASAYFARFYISSSKKRKEYWNRRVQLALFDSVEMIAIHSEMQWFLGLTILWAVLAGFTLELSDQADSLSMFVIALVLLIVHLLIAQTRREIIKEIRDKKLDQAILQESEEIANN